LSAGSWLLRTCDGKMRFVSPATLSLLMLLLLKEKQALYSPSSASTQLCLFEYLMERLLQLRPPVFEERHTNYGPSQGRIINPASRARGHPSGRVIQVALIQLPAGRFIDRVVGRTFLVPSGPLDSRPCVSFLSGGLSWHYNRGRRAGTMIVRAFLAVFAVVYVHVYLRVCICLAMIALAKWAYEVS